MNAILEGRARDRLRPRATTSRCCRSSGPPTVTNESAQSLAFLEAWSLYHMGRYEASRDRFRQLYQDVRDGGGDGRIAAGRSASAAELLSGRAGRARRRPGPSADASRPRAGLPSVRNGPRCCGDHHALRTAWPLAARRARAASATRLCRVGGAVRRIVRLFARSTAGSLPRRRAIRKASVQSISPSRALR